MSIVIGDFEVVSEPAAKTDTAESANQEQPSGASSFSPAVLAVVEQYLTERALRVWAD